MAKIEKFEDIQAWKKAQLYVARDAGLIDKTRFDSLHRMAIETGNLIGGFMRYLSRESAGRESQVKNDKNSKRS